MEGAKLKYVRASFVGRWDSSKQPLARPALVPNGLDRPLEELFLPGRRGLQMSGGWAALAALVPTPSGRGRAGLPLDSPLGVLLRPLGDTPQEPRCTRGGATCSRTAPRAGGAGGRARFGRWTWASGSPVATRCCTMGQGRLHSAGRGWTLAAPRSGRRASRAPCSGGVRPGRRRGRGLRGSSARSHAITPRPRTSLGSHPERAPAPRGPGRSSCRFSACAC